MNVLRHFLPWDRPLLPQVVDFLAAGWAGGKPLDLSRILVVVPTRQSGRRLREALAAHAATHRQAVFAPKVITPDRLLEPALGLVVASPLESLLAWTAVLQEIDLDDCRAVIPFDPPQRNFAWALSLARTLGKLQRDLAEGGLHLADVADLAGEFPETDRWEQLGALEQIHAARLARDGLRDGQAAKLDGAKKGSLPSGIERVLILATPDPLPLALVVLERHAQSVPVEILIHAPAVLASGFDPWGRPLAEVWEQRVLPMPAFAQRVHLCADPAAQAAWLTAQAQAYVGSGGVLALGVADADVLSPVESALRAAGLAVFNPEGRLRRQDGFHALLTALAHLVREPDFEAVAAVARCPEVLAWMATVRGSTFSAQRWLAGLDALYARHLPADLPAARQYASRLSRYPALGAELELIQELHDVLAGNRLSESVPAVLTKLFSGQPATLPNAWVETVEAWMEIVRICARAEKREPGLTAGDWWQLALSLHGDGRQTEEKPVGALELQGWLELPWEDAAHLVVAGLNDGSVPDAVAGDAFLPESLRVRLGLKSNAARFARDAFLLQSLAATREHAGRLDLLYGKFSSEGEPLRPSRLLLRCADADLADRVKFLFRDPDLPGSPVAWRRAWPLRLPRRPAPRRVSVTALKGWLDCPLRFYLRHVLGMEAVDPAKAELDAFDFGTLCHGALEALGIDQAMRDCTDAGVLRGFLLAELERRMRDRFGNQLTLPLLVQLESARQRLAKAAEVHARERAEGWVIVAVERKFELPVEGMMIAGKIDRIERHEGTGDWRVLDFKTSDRAVDPADAHLRGQRVDEAPMEWAKWSGGSKLRVWSDLQLPLYRRVIAAEAKAAAVHCAYFNLPKATGETGVRTWEGFTPEMEESAWRCAQGVVGAIQGGIFWPPRELNGREAEQDEFSALFHGGAAASLVWEKSSP